MELFPAIDVKDKQVIRLTYGDYSKAKVYSDNPLNVSRKFADCGAKNIHIVDLDGAKDGNLANFDVIGKIVQSSGLFAEVGGGIRNEERMRKYLDCGAGRVIIGTAAVENFDLVKSAVKMFGDKIAVGVDAKNGRVAVHGWKTETNIDSVEFCKSLAAAGVSTVIYTDISKDGAMEGTNLEVYRQLVKIKGLNIIASGGITFYDELSELNDIGVYGAILGKAMYEGKIDLAEAVKQVENFQLSLSGFKTE